MDIDPNLAKNAPGITNSNGTALQAYRVFSGKRSIGGSIVTFTQAKDEVDLKVTLTVEPPQPFRIYLRSFDTMVRTFYIQKNH